MAKTIAILFVCCVWRTTKKAHLWRVGLVGKGACGEPLFWFINLESAGDDICVSIAI